MGVPNETLDMVRFREAVEAWLAAAQPVVAAFPEVLRTVYKARREPVEKRVRLTRWHELDIDITATKVQADPALWALSETADVVDVVGSDTRLAELVLGWASLPPDAPRSELVRVCNGLLGQVLIEHWHATGALGEEPKALERLMAMLEMALVDPETIPVHWIVQFWNLASDVPSILLEPAVHLRQGTTAEWEEEIARAGPPGQYGFVGTNWNDFSLGAVLDVEGTLGDLPKGGETERDPGHRRGRAALLGLRVLHSGWVAMRLVRATSENPFTGRLIARTGLTMDQEWEERTPLGGAYTGLYVVTDDIAQSLAANWSQLMLAIDDEALIVPRSRLADVYNRRKASDRLIDTWIALESMFLRAKQREDLTEILASSVSHYLGGNKADRDAIYADIKALYDWRSAVAHGERPAERQGRKLTVEQAAEQSAAYLRRSLLRRIAES